MIGLKLKLCGKEVRGRCHYPNFAFGWSCSEDHSDEGTLLVVYWFYSMQALKSSSFCQWASMVQIIPFCWKTSNKSAHFDAVAARYLLQIFLLKIPDGLFGAEVEHRLLSVLDLNSRCDQCDAIHWYVIRNYNLTAECMFSCHSLQTLCTCTHAHTHTVLHIVMPV